MQLLRILIRSGKTHIRTVNRSLFSPIVAPCIQSIQDPNQHYRHLWGWLNSVFNRVDEQRIKEVGPDRACAEWLLRCGAKVKWSNQNEWIDDYNSLPIGQYSLKIVEVDATDSCVMGIGFPHFRTRKRGLQHLRKIVFHKCNYMEDEAMSQISLLKSTLKHLQVSSCGNVTDEGVMSLAKLANLETLLLYDLFEVRNREKCMQVLQDALPTCKIDFPYAKTKQ